MFLGDSSVQARWRAPFLNGWVLALWKGGFAHAATYVQTKELHLPLALWLEPARKLQAEAGCDGQSTCSKGSEHMCAGHSYVTLVSLTRWAASLGL